MDQTQLSTLRTGAQTAGDESTKLVQDIPGMLSGLKSNLTSIFTHNNPDFAARENALTTFLNEPSQTRSELLGQDLSPTSQNAIVTARHNAAMIPLAGLNQSIVGQYGNIGDILGNATTLYQTQAEAAKQKATNALNLYQSAIKEYEAFHPAGGGGGLGNLGSILTALLTQNNQPKPNPAQFDQPDIPTQPSTNFQSANLFGAPETPGLWDSLLSLIGATPKQPQQQAITPGIDLSGYNFGNTPIKLGV